MKTILLIPVSAALFAFAGCLSQAVSDGGYPATVDEAFTDCADASALVGAWEKGGNFIARFEYLPGARGSAPAKYLAPLADNVGRQIWGKDANFAGNGSYERRRGMWNFEEVRYLGGRLEVWLNGYRVIAAGTAGLWSDRAAVRWIGFTGGEEVRNLRIRELPACAKPGCGCPKMRMKRPSGFTACFDGDEADLSAHWKGVTTEERFDNPIVRAAATDGKRAEMQRLADRERDAHWSVVDGALHFDGFKGGYSLATKGDYADFELWADWRLLSVTGDSGLYLRGAPQVQIWDAHNQWNIGSGGLYNNEKHPSKALVIADRRIGDWNRFHVVLRGDKVTVWLNGELVVDRVTLENYWDRTRPIFPCGQIELQCHGDPTEWRNIFIRPLPSREKDFGGKGNGDVPIHE